MLHSSIYYHFSLSTFSSHMWSCFTPEFFEQSSSITLLKTFAMLTAIFGPVWVTLESFPLKKQNKKNTFNPALELQYFCPLGFICLDFFLAYLCICSYCTKSHTLAFHGASHSALCSVCFDPPSFQSCSGNKPRPTASMSECGCTHTGALCSDACGGRRKRCGTAGPN